MGLFGRIFGRDKNKAAQTAGSAPDPIRYKMKNKLVSFGGDSYIENAKGERVFKVNGKMLRIRDTIIFEDLHGVELAKIQEKLLRVKDTMKIEKGDDTLATVKKAIVDPLRPRFEIHMANGDEFVAQGNILEHEYEIKRGDWPVAIVSKKWFRVRDTYGIEMTPGAPEIVILASTACIDEMSK
jgi:uncharacterized protein YxjI